MIAPKRPPLSFGKKLFFSFATTFFVLLGLEFGLWLFGVAPGNAIDDPFLGFSQYTPLFEAKKDESGRESYVTRSSKEVWFNHQSFPKPKPERTRRIFCVGGSTAYGHPYADSTSFSRWLREYLPLADGSCRWEVINGGGISYASYRDAALVEEFSRYQPDYFIVYSVHNEFLERRTYAGMFERPPLVLEAQSFLARTRCWTAMDRFLQQFGAGPSAKKELLPGEVDEILNHTVGPLDYHRDQAWRDSVLKHYAFNLQRMVRIAQKVGAKVILVTPISNEKDCSPFKFESSDSLSLEQATSIQHRMEQAWQLHLDGNCLEALNQLLPLSENDPQNALLQYQLGKIYESLRRYGEAKHAYRKAIEEDVCPLRAVQGIRHAMVDVSKTPGVTLVDLETKLRDHAKESLGHDLIGDEFFVDHVHFNIDIHRRLALWIIEGMQAQGWIADRNLKDPSMRKDIALVMARVYSEVDEEQQGIALRNLAKVFHWAGKFSEAQKQARAALDLLGEDPESRYIIARCLQNQGLKKEALEEYERLFADGVGFGRACQPFGELLAEEGHFQAAKAYLLMSVLHNPNNEEAKFSLGQVHFHLGEASLAAECFETVDRKYPGDASTQWWLARAYLAGSQWKKAEPLLERLLGEHPNVASVHQMMAECAEKQGHQEVAEQHRKKAQELDPQSSSPPPSSPQRESISKPQGDGGDRTRTPQGEIPKL